MILLDHSTYDDNSIVEHLGDAEYSYWFVRKAFRDVLTAFGTIVPITDPAREADVLHAAAQARGEACVLLSYNPPHQFPAGLACPVVPVFAWEFDTIPDESWNGDPLDDWRVALAQAGCAVTHSSAAAAAVRRTMGAAFPVWTIPAPMMRRGAPWRASARGRQHGHVPLDPAVAIDVGAIDLSLFAADRTADAAAAVRLLHHAAGDPARAGRQLALDGIVFTSVFNPADGRKAWDDMLAAFVTAFRDTPDAILVLKLTHWDFAATVQPMLAHIAKLGRFACRIVLIQGMLPDRAYAALIEATSFAVNASQGEGQCLPLMEFMAAGRPAVAPRHSAMIDYVTDENSFVVASDVRPAAWPHDERGATRCLRHVVRVDDLVRRFRAAYAVGRDDPGRYARMSAAAAAAQEAYCSDAVVTARLAELFDHVARLPPVPAAAAPQLEIADREDPYMTGLYDATLTGWYEEDSGEMRPGFPVSARDVVVDVGCGDGGPVTFCARRGAHIVLVDVDAERVARTAETMRRTPARRVEHHVSDSTPLPLADGIATRVICMEVLEHVDDPRAVVDELVRIGAPGALFLISVPAHQSERVQRQLAPPSSFQKPNHIRTFGPGELRAVIEAAGLEVVVSDSHGFFWAMLLAMFWQTELPLGQTHRSFETWASLWRQILAGKDGLRIKRALDEALPSVQSIVARRPG